MFHIECPWCGMRDQTEFTAHGEAHIARPEETASLTDEEWGDYVFFATIPKASTANAGSMHSVAGDGSMQLEIQSLIVSM